MIRFPIIGLVYTRTCPLACAHCIAESSPQARGRMDPERVRDYLPIIRQFTEHLSFTGGEPLLYHREIVDLTVEARKLGLAVSVVTGSGWAKSETLARERIRALVDAGIHRLVVSWDAYHEVFAAREMVLAVARAGCEAGLRVDVRTVVPATGSVDEYHALFRDLPVRLESARPAQLGSARDLPDADFHWSETPPKGVCSVVLRPAIEPDGSVYACCGPGRYSRVPSPLVLGNVNETPLEDILARATDPILEAIRRVGPHGLYTMLRGAGTPELPLRPRYSGVCELCLDLNGSPEVVAALRERLTWRENRMLLAAAKMWAERPLPAAETRGPAV
jgi:hypothetical protein